MHDIHVASAIVHIGCCPQTVSPLWTLVRVVMVSIHGCGAGCAEVLYGVGSCEGTAHGSSCEYECSSGYRAVSAEAVCELERWINGTCEGQEHIIVVV